jgi:putative transposase
LGISERRACRIVGQPRSTRRKPHRVPGDEVVLSDAIAKLASVYGRYGYRGITSLLRARGWRRNAKQVQRTWQREGLA